MKQKAARKKKAAVLRKHVSRAGINLTSGETNSAAEHERGFREVVALIECARERADQTVNTELIDLYWRVGEYISHKLTTAEWGEKVVGKLALYIHRRTPNLRGFSRPNLFRMKQFYETYCVDGMVSPLVRLLPWTIHLILIGQCKRTEEREFYMRVAIREKWGKRELERQISACLFERAVVSPPKVAAALRQSHPEAADIFKDAYLVEFLQLPDGHLEADLHRGLLAKLKCPEPFCFPGADRGISDPPAGQGTPPAQTPRVLSTGAARNRNAENETAEKAVILTFIVRIISK
jgi:predicted nuclease of restriction endonuclease-like (RecB) superfamily